jgi:hypothetical protein
MIKCLFVALFLFCAAVSASTSKDIIVKTDKFTGETSVVLKSFGVSTFADQNGKLVQLAMGAGYVSKEGSEPMLLITCFASSYKLLDGADVHALADGERIDLGHFKPGTATLSTSVAIMTNEVVAGYIDRTTFSKLANAKDLQFKIEFWQIKLKDKNIEKLREFIAALPAPVLAAK